MDNDIDMNLALLRILETKDKGATKVVKNVVPLESAVMEAKSDTPMRQSLESYAFSTSHPASPKKRGVSIRPSLQTLLDYAANVPRFQPNKPRSLSESDVQKAMRDASLLKRRLPSDIIVRDFASTRPHSFPSPGVNLPTPILVALRARKNQPIYTASRIVPIRTQDLVQLKSTLERLSLDTRLPPDLSPKHVGEHPIRYTMPPATDLAEILHPALVEAIQSSEYQALAPKGTRCFCSLVLHEIQRRVPDTRLDIHGPRDHAHLQSQLRSILTDNEAVADKLLALYGDALRLHTHARMNARPMRLDSWAEIIGMMMEDVFTLGRHPVFELVGDADGQSGSSNVSANEEVQAAQQKRREEGSLRSGKTSVTRRGRLNRFKYKGKKRVFRSKAKRWDFFA